MTETGKGPYTAMLAVMAELGGAIGDLHQLNALALECGTTAASALRAYTTLEAGSKAELHRLRDALMEAEGIAATPAEARVRAYDEWREREEMIGALKADEVEARALARYFATRCAIIMREVQAAAEVAHV